MDLKSLQYGLSLGLSGKPLPIGGGEPVIPDTPTATHYFYGHVAGADETPDAIIDGVAYVGAVLPKLPEYDESKYPILTIDNSSMNSTFAEMFADYTSTEETLGSGTRVPYIEYVGDSLYTSLDYFGAWRELKQRTSGSNYANEIFWTNTDIVDMNGNIVIRKCPDPIPVYE